MLLRSLLPAVLTSTPFGFAEASDGATRGFGPLILLPQDRGNESPACLDGSSYGFYLVRSTAGSKKWTINLSGGGWCNDEEECYSRSRTELGSSKGWSKTSACPCHNVLEDGHMDADCNCVWMPYADGASFSGYRAEPVPVPSNRSKVVYFRGIKNFDATLDYLFHHGLGTATEFVLTGGSAGGLSTFLHTDRVAERLAKEAPNCKHVRALPEVGYFLDHGNIKHDGNNYTAWMQYIYHMQNLTFGADGALAPACREAYPEQPHYCFMSPHMQQFVKTPFFMLNSKYDEWQLQNELQTAWDTKEAQAAVIQYGQDFLDQLKPVKSEPKNGAFITSCICHDCPWEQLVLANKTAYQHFADWHYGRTSGAKAIHVDPRGPDGEGSIKLDKCDPFPAPRAPLIV